ncbi:hypothetical protein KUV57_11180 [Epibacterium sp. DP7N7-1]|nr:hypothetical protein [Epibacterium sp. DP7N7-1]
MEHSESPASPAGVWGTAPIRSDSDVIFEHVKSVSVMFFHILLEGRLDVKNEIIMFAKIDNSPMMYLDLGSSQQNSQHAEYGG